MLATATTTGNSEVDAKSGQKL